MAMTNLLLFASVFELLLPRPDEVVEAEGRADAAALTRVETRIAALPVAAPAETAEEAYRLEIGPKGVVITAPTERGARHARTTLEQLRKLSTDGSVPAAVITDYPAMKWRGILLDCGRNYVALPIIREVIDFLAKYKYSVFHWHLSDYHGWRLESKRYPELQSAKAFTRQIGRYYTQAEFREIVAFAAERGITVVPEIDVPGHSAAFRRAFGFEKMDTPGVERIVCELIDELCSLAEAKTMPVIHLGTDEVRNKEEYIKEEWYDLWAEQVAKNGRTVMGWWPGHVLRSSGPVIQEGWYEIRPPSGPYVDARCCCYIDSFSPWSLLAQAEFNRVGGWWPETKPEWRLGGEIQAWHDDRIEESSDVVRDNPVFPAIMLYSDMLWHDRESHVARHAFAPPARGEAGFDRLVDLERRVLAQRDRVLADFPHPIQFVRQSDLRWTIAGEDGRVHAKDVPGATVYVESPRKDWGYPGFATSPTNTAVLTLEFDSPFEGEAGAFIELSEFHRSGARSYGLPRDGEWNRVGATVKLNGETVEPPKWNHPGAKGKELEEVPWSDECAWIRPPTPIRVKKGVNRVEIRLPKPKDDWYWSASFVPVAGTREHPHEL